MAIEMTMLGCSVILGLVQIGLVAMFSVGNAGSAGQPARVTSRRHR